MGTGRTDEFRKEAVRIALTSGLSRRQVADDLGVGFSTLNKWVSARREPPRFCRRLFCVSYAAMAG
jgi:transposase